MATKIERIKKDVYNVNNKVITLIGRIIPLSLINPLTTEERMNLRDLIRCEDKADINK